MPGCIRIILLAFQRRYSPQLYHLTLITLLAKHRRLSASVWLMRTLAYITTLTISQNPG